MWNDAERNKQSEHEVFFLYESDRKIAEKKRTTLSVGGRKSTLVDPPHKFPFDFATHSTCIHFDFFFLRSQLRWFPVCVFVVMFCVFIRFITHFIVANLHYINGEQATYSELFHRM